MREGRRGHENRRGDRRGEKLVTRERRARPRGEKMWRRRNTEGKQCMSGEGGIQGGNVRITRKLKKKWMRGEVVGGRR